MADDGRDDAASVGTRRQHVERVPGSRRARLTRVAGTLGDADAEATLRGKRPAPPAGDEGPDAARLRRDVPPHWG